MALAGFSPEEIELVQKDGASVGRAIRDSDQVTLKYLKAGGLNCATRELGAVQPQAGWGIRP